MATKKKSKQKPYWERAYRGHAFWKGKLKLGRVTLLSANPKGRYHWEAAGRAGYSEDLAKAKAAVELAVLSADKQLDLFQA
ncbi:MAG: hypothetical protein M3544_00215 [Pseudomonadota bacterium]|nr:hypothetical protein [Pseudomonadota bacterium]